MLLTLTRLVDYVNVLLVFVPIGIVAGVTEWDPVTVFILNFLAIIPLASVLSFATEEISAKLGEALGGLLNATFGNAVELIVSETICAAGSRPELMLTMSMYRSALLRFAMASTKLSSLP